MKFKLLIFSFIAMVIASFSVGCGKTETGSDCSLTAGINISDTGAHDIYANDIKLQTILADLKPIRDSLSVKVIGDSVSIFSKVLNIYMPGKIDPTDCNKVILDSVIIDGAALAFETELAGIDSVRISNVKAGGSGTLTATGATTRINIIKANTNILIGAPGGFGDLQNIEGKGINLRGTFLKIP